MATSKRSSKRLERRRPPRRLRHRARGRSRLASGKGRVQPARPLVARPSLQAPVVDPHLAEGIALFNHRQFFECHDVLEQLWLRTAGRPRDFYKGLIQAAVAFYHWSRDNPSGAMSLYRSSSRHLRKYRPAFQGVEVEAFLRQYTELFGWLRRHRLRYDARLVPTIRCHAL